MPTLVKMDGKILLPEAKILDKLQAFWRGSAATDAINSDIGSLDDIADPVEPQ